MKPLILTVLAAFSLQGQAIGFPRVYVNTHSCGVYPKMDDMKVLQQARAQAQQELKRRCSIFMHGFSRPANLAEILDFEIDRQESEICITLQIQDYCIPTK